MLEVSGFIDPDNDAKGYRREQLSREIKRLKYLDLIYTNTSVTQDNLSDLAEARAITVQNFMIEKGQLAPERLFLKKPDITAPPDQKATDRARVELGATVR